ncbi:hypothetical protein N7448_005635 [Penicillium atrosanguineum]|uniref:Rhodopsin domain-containing protein n=1 Tax=Penicillium atrosanguineum TaxID=1132637 RepID=A0A9W9H3Q7_9EURO|nr:uncharacterized protein N7443_009376 [Penicillium atrosanguineum]KAJ5126332.1 hypothetical protein N7526_008509 [Penicillium atrosanguineum]KAJ5137081.1 hypothetical protein N7448_005635 [Penicillium atrosanguineum]KAJ5293423.1 hypothetical protein N7443_009376 [Penicillium atrosanguineum]KAJ5302544.1 hypothetical protein N7476_009343 [Penicillium atrosanguineum]
MVSIVTVIGPAPKGVDLSADRIKTDNAVVISFSCLAMIAVAIRFYMKLKGAKTEFKKLALDDWLVAAALAPLVALLAIALLAGHYGMGKHIWVMTVENMIKMKKILFAYLFIYIFELFIVKLSLLMFYRRIFGTSGNYWVCIILALGWAFGSMIALLTCPAPVSYFWNELTNPGGGNYRYNFYNYYVGNAASNVITDFLILLVPLPVIWKLKMRVAQKFMVSGVLLLGIFVCAISIVRLHYIMFLKDDLDITWTMGNVYVWSTLEPCVAIICACLPALQPVIQSAMKLEYIIHIRSRLRPSKRARQILRLEKHFSNISNGSSHRLRPVTPSMDRPGSVEPAAEIETQCVPVKSASPRISPKEKKNLEEYLGPMYIMVQHDVEWSETHIVH